MEKLPRRKSIRKNTLYYLSDPIAQKLIDILHDDSKVVLQQYLLKSDPDLLDQVMDMVKVVNKIGKSLNKKRVAAPIQKEEKIETIDKRGRGRPKKV